MHPRLNVGCGARMIWRDRDERSDHALEGAGFGACRDGGSSGCYRSGSGEANGSDHRTHDVREPDGHDVFPPAGEPALVFIHGGLANRGFWDVELKSLAAHHRIIALDLPGHGESGSNRQKWGMPEFGADVRAVINAERVKKVIIFGNSLGGPVAIEAALLLPGQVVGVVGVDTFQSFTTLSAEEARQRAEAFRDNYAAR
jgi:pimeloyl-ACP methyl ester carboxylesterase